MTELIATFTPKYINKPAPSKNGGTIPANVKDQDDVKWNLGRSITLEMFQVGVPVQVAYTEKENNGYLNRNIMRIVETQSRPIQQPPKPQPKETQREKSPKENENIFVNGKLSAAISAGAVEFQEDALVNAGNMLRRVYARLYKPINIQNTENEFNDEIPDFTKL